MVYRWCVDKLSASISSQHKDVDDFKKKKSFIRLCLFLSTSNRYCPAVLTTLGFTQVHAEFTKALKKIAAQIDRRNEIISREGRLPVFKIFNPVDAPYMFIT